jgi:hypothetical protein
MLEREQGRAGTIQAGGTEATVVRTPYDDVTSGGGASESPPGQHIASQHRDPRLNGVATRLAHSQVRGH